MLKQVLAFFSKLYHFAAAKGVLEFDSQWSLKKFRLPSGQAIIETQSGIQPSPKRGRGSWDEFVEIHAETLWQVDFFCKMTVTQTRLGGALRHYERLAD
ncbi:MAG: hypothetical protein ACR2NU_15075 [Aeoliella sp.]